ncbi:MAG TPA: ferritin-like domain-containing protein [archaeon]|nr:ferritin-like domain-containing protein [archaeon]
MSFLLSKEDKKALIEALNHDVSLELGAIIQYVYHHIMSAGMESPEISEMQEDLAQVEMKHLEKFLNRVDYLGGVPTTKINEIKMGGSLKKMIQDDLDGENNAIKTYKQNIALAAKLGDTTTRLMLEEIVSDEEDHAYGWQTVLEKKKG